MAELLPRITGTELETALQVLEKNTYVTPNNLTLSSIMKDHLPVDLHRMKTPSASLFTGNGGRIYIDVGDHIELATAEDDSFWGTAANEVAMEQLLAKAVSNFTDNNGSVPYSLQKRVVDSGGMTWGYHENYFMPHAEEMPKGMTLIPLLAHLATRQIFTGAGRVTSTGAFRLSQKLHDVETDVSSDTVRGKPLLNTRDEPHAGEGTRGKRLHVVSGDPNMMTGATFMKLGTTSIVLRLIESGNDYLSWLGEIESFATAARVFNTDPSLTQTVEVGRRRMTALNIQELLFEQSQLFASRYELPFEETVALRRWEETLDSLAIDPMACDDTIEWVAKYQMLQKRRSLKGYAINDPRLQLIDLRWGELNHRGIGTALRKSSWAASTDHKLIARRMYHPPNTTRALPRAWFIGQMRDSDKSAIINWNSIKLDNNPVVSLPDPRNNDCSQVESLLKRARRAA